MTVLNFKFFQILDFCFTRYNIPDPDPTAEQQMAIERGEIPNREDLKRFRKEFAKPIQLRFVYLDIIPGTYLID